MEKFTVDYFIEKFEKIPEENWCMIDLRKIDGRRCVMGHCGMTSYDFTSEAKALYNLLLPLSLNDGSTAPLLYGINDGLFDRYMQPTPKQRILAALYDIRAMQNSEQEVQESDTTKAQSSEEAGYIKTTLEFKPVTFEKIEIPELSNN